MLIGTWYSHPRCRGWTTWADWLDLDPPKKRKEKENLRETLERKDYSKTNYLPFEEARAYVQKQELTIVRPSALCSQSAFPSGGKPLCCLSSHTTTWHATSADMDASR
jgi:hypothetical protein